MNSAAFIIIAVAVACDSAPVIPQADSKGLQHLLDGLRGIELWRQELMKYALETNKDDLNLPQISQILYGIDSWMIEARKYYESINIFLQSDEKSLDAKEAVANITKLREEIKQLEISFKDQAREIMKSVDSGELPTGEEWDLLEKALQATMDVLILIDTKLRGKTENSPNKYLKDIKTLHHLRKF